MKFRDIFRSMKNLQHYPTARRASRVFGGLALVVLLAWTAGSRVEVRRIFMRSPCLIDDDHSQHLPAFVDFGDRDAEGDDSIIEYARAYQPAAYRVLMDRLTVDTPPLMAAKRLGGVLSAVLWASAFLCGWALAGWSGAIAALLLTLHGFLMETQTIPGLYRSFAFPLFMLFGWGLMTKRWWFSAAVALALALFYPPLFLVCWTALALAPGFSPLILPGRKKQRFAIFFMLSVVAGLMLLGLADKPDFFGPVTPIEEARFMEDWGPRGRLTEVPFPSYGEAFWKAGQTGLLSEGRPKNGFVAQVAWPALFLAVSLFGAVRNPRYRRLAVPVLAGSVIWYACARGAAFHLGFPDRMLMFSLPTLALLAWPAAWKRNTFWNTVGLTIVVVGLFVAQPIDTFRARNELFVDLQRFHPVLDVIRDLPDDTRLAVWPETMTDSIPLLSRKRILAGRENAQPVYVDYYSRMRDRLTDTVYLCLAADAHEAARIRDRYGLTHLLAPKRLYDDELRTPGIFEPFNAFASAYRKRMSPDSLYMAQPPAESVVYEDRLYALIDLRNLPTVPTAEQTASDADAPVLASFLHRMELLEVEWAPSEAAPGESIRIRYAWRIHPWVRVARWLTMAHFIHEEGRRLVADHPLLVSVPQQRIDLQAEGTVFTHEQIFQIPDDAPPGRYRFGVGILERQHGDRVPPHTECRVQDRQVMLEPVLEIRPVRAVSDRTALP